MQTVVLHSSKEANGSCSLYEKGAFVDTVGRESKSVPLLLTLGSMTSTNRDLSRCTVHFSVWRLKCTQTEKVLSSDLHMFTWTCVHQGQPLTLSLTTSVSSVFTQSECMNAGICRITGYPLCDYSSLPLVKEQDQCLWVRKRHWILRLFSYSSIFETGHTWLKTAWWKRKWDYWPASLLLTCLGRGTRFFVLLFFFCCFVLLRVGLQS